MTDKDLSQAIGLLRALDHFTRDGFALAEKIRSENGERGQFSLCGDPESLRTFFEREIVRHAKQVGPAAFIILKGEKEEGR